jgi:hypothetical protein
VKRIFSFILMSVFVLSSDFIYAQQNYNKAGASPTDSYKEYSGPREKVEDSPGMEFIKIGNITVFVPEDMKVYEADGRIILEEEDPYMARRFKETDARLNKIDETLKELKQEIEKLKNEDNKRNN